MPELAGIFVGMDEKDSYALLRSSSTPAVAYAGLVWLVAPRAVFPVVVYRPEMLGIMAVLDQKDLLSLISFFGFTSLSPMSISCLLSSPLKATFKVARLTLQTRKL